MEDGLEEGEMFLFFLYMYFFIILISMEDAY